MLSGIVFSEFFGYWLHVLLHSERIPWLSRNHMIHHLVIYPPNKPQRPSGAYLPSTAGRTNLLGIGLEWLAPAGLALASLVLAFRALGIGPASQAAFIAAALVWSWLMFGYMHDAMHLKGFWMEGNTFMASWFLSRRKKHDIHHMDLDDAGRMRKNYGICFFAFDALFGSLQNEHERFNGAGLAAALDRYAYVFSD